ncbi:Hsp20/alpha crystallin family protein [Mycolicibacterium sp. ND9-15]|uniref:Hsp20/alpha crystallin family protein n=1 Tax=Mycolicibacterium sp. ND9-15 TaxID=3042320 RepID=UPI002DDB8A67|nr:Hsp20/alpha crystallin family protein [Mycolicibacterium sp. ND9-15]WSE58172.1 Hsp20/alpha crystallin family protein [Mycolicibacterium sp. ND9-15]
MSTLALRTRPAWDLDRWVRDFFGPVTAEHWSTGAFTPAVEIVRDGDDALVRVELPGLDVEKDVNVEVDRGYLVVHGERRDERASDPAKDVRYIREVRYGSFRRSFKLPDHVTGQDIKAEYDAGVLTLRVAGAHKGAQAQRIAIETK